ncbi:MAG: hypothetical protein ACKVS8_13385 [Phycisphaerales bacterium]
MTQGDHKPPSRNVAVDSGEAVLARVTGIAFYVGANACVAVGSLPDTSGWSARPTHAAMVLGAPAFFGAALVALCQRLRRRPVAAHVILFLFSAGFGLALADSWTTRRMAGGFTEPGMFWRALAFAPCLYILLGRRAAIWGVCLAAVLPGAVHYRLSWSGSWYIHKVVVSQLLWTAIILAPFVWFLLRPALTRGPGMCARCGYDLTGLSGWTCPECGTSFGGVPPSTP